MPRPDLAAPRRGRPIVTRSLALLLVAACGTDRPAPTAPAHAPSARRHAPDARGASGAPIVVTSSAELIAALVPEHAGRRIVVRAGSYAVSQLLRVPDGATLEGAGTMRLDGARRPTGFAPGTRTTITMIADIPGDVLTLGHGAAVRAVALEDRAGRAGNVIAVVSREAGDRVSATVSDVEIVVPTPHGVVPQGPTGCGIAVMSLNPNMGGDPPPHTGSAIAARVTRTLIRSTAGGIGCGVFAFNFAASSTVAVTLDHGVVGGGMIASGGVSRPDAVHDARTTIVSSHTLYRSDAGDPCAARRLGWNVLGGAGSPVPMPNPGASRNVLRIVSTRDRLEGFTTGVLATGARRFFGPALSGAMNDNAVDLVLVGTTIVTPACAGPAPVADLRLAGALVTDATVQPGDGNVLRAVLRGVTGSGPRANAFTDVLGPLGPQPPSLAGTNNRLVIAGTPRAFSNVNRGIEPAPGAAYFTGGGR